MKLLLFVLFFYSFVFISRLLTTSFFFAVQLTVLLIVQ